MKNFRFNPDRVAYFEVEGWKAYYDRNWIQLLRLVVALAQEQFRIPFPVSLLAAYYVTRASVQWVPVEHDMNKVRMYNEKFYRIARRYSGLTFDPARVAALESQYWDVHRQLVRQPDKTAFIETMIDLHAAVFGLTREQARESGELRVQANNVLDTITGKISDDPARDWKICEDLLRRCYTSIQQRREQRL
ncbi:MAG: hypothetical protein K8L97_26690 [Anaerolineae bacterium]|nr:hypothetical protein [Anaerolineae bacterium]